jgi:hypothetical protein
VKTPRQRGFLSHNPKIPMFEAVLSSVLVLIMFAIVWLLTVLSKEIDRQGTHRPKQSKQPSPQPKQLRPSKSHQPTQHPLYAGVSSHTQSKLLSLVNGDHATAERLVRQIQRTSRESAQWCWEKAVFDLERDRR